MKNFEAATKRFLRDEKGTEIVEWAIVGGLVVAVGAAIFLGIGTDASTALGLVKAQTAQAAAG